MTSKIDTLLLKCTGALDDPEPLGAGLAALVKQHGLSPVAMHSHAALARGEFYVYVDLAAPVELDAADMARIDSAARGVRELEGLNLNVDVRASRLIRVFERPGASSGEAALFHYCVEFDPAEGWEPEIASWYDAEHMTGLAAVPGCARAQRFLNLDAGPRSLACYDLASPAVRESKPWLDVVTTPWSSRVRPHFHNTKRTMFRRISGA